MAKTFAMIIGGYIICWAPITIMFIVMTITENLQFFQNNWILGFFQMFTICIAHFSPAVNPFIYAYRIKDVRDTVKQVFFRKTLKNGIHDLNDKESDE